MIFCRREGPSNVVRALKYCEQKNFVMSRTSDCAALSFGNRFSLVDDDRREILSKRLADIIAGRV